MLVSAALLFSACGKRRPPLPPLESVPQRTELLSGAQRGNQVILSWPAPRLNAPEGSVQSIRRVDIYRLAERVDDPLPLTEEEFSARATLIGSVPFSQITDASGTVIYVDELALVEPVRLRYSLRYVNAAGQRAPFSNFLIVEPAPTVSRPPVVAGPPEVSQDAVVISWQAPASNIDGSTPPNLLGYNVYRTGRSPGAVAARPLNPEPLTSGTFSDQTFQFGEEYIYVVRAVSLGTGGQPVESLNSNSVTVMPADTFSPTPPPRLTAAATPAPPRVSLFWAANPERDVVGYFIYRSIDETRPREDWTRLNQRPSEKTTYQDEDVRPGTRYFYFVRAVDSAGNLSEPSEVASDQVP
ncbi:MAG TPA: hypothetical protein VEY09_01340 [Pyrinomonadaceae bacterium]|nr:hypothetical protein [Pyrinomonadaceae bacterium]